ncbi:homoserine O-acetyltransferase [candidate division KSB1 bacterium]|nr:homoserine O-acetyltransferase [candidate division KSB1 bacterium]
MPDDPYSVCIVETQYFTFAESPNEMPLESGEKLGPITLAYETYGTLNNQKNNAILILHALSGDAHVAGRYSAEDPKPGWWDFMVGAGRPFDTDKYFIICSNVIGGCKGSTGPASINPKTKKPYNLSFPVITIGDMVRAQTHLIDHLGIDRLMCVVGGSMGGMQTLEWAVEYPDRVAAAIPMATTCRLGVQGIAFDEVARQAIYADANWKKGDYLNHGVVPAQGLAVARMLAHITYLSEAAMHQKFGRQLREKEHYGYDFSTEFEVESYLHHQGESFIRRFDANTYLYITKAINYFDLYRDYGTLEKAFRNVNSKFMVVSFASDWLYTTAQNKEIVKALKINRKPVTFCEIPSQAGHDAFLLPNPDMEKMIADFLAHVYD